MHRVTPLVAAFAFGSSLAAQSTRDSTPNDTLRITTLGTLEVRVTRAAETRLRVPAAVAVVDSQTLHGDQLQNGLDEAIGRIPGVYAANRFNASLDQRLVIRGAGARGNFGVRGLKILLDGLPQTLPDGQSQLNNLDLGFVDRAEVLLGASSALYGNAAGGVLAFSSDIPARDQARLRLTAGSFGTTRVSGRAGLARGPWSGTAVATWFQSDGTRQQSGNENRQLSLGLNRLLGGEWLIKGRYFFASSPEARNPGALTLAELGRNPDSAAAANILRGADKRVRQHQAGFTVERRTPAGHSFEAAAFGLTRDLENPLATAPPGPAGPTVGTYSAIDRVVGGGRVAASWLLARATRLSLGTDAQWMRDDRTNRRSRGGTPSDTTTADQRETVSEIGPYLSFHWEASNRLLITSAIRYDRIGFRVRDRFLGDGVDQSGTKSMSAGSGSLGASLLLSPGVALYASTNTAFESPTTTELVNQANGTIGFNDDLGPQRASTVEAGVKTTGSMRVSLGVYRTRVRDALVQAREQDGRAFFENAARQHIRGLELGLDWRPAPWFAVMASYTHTDARFARYASKNGATVDTLDGNQVPGIPRHTFRGVASFRVSGATLEWDQQIVSRFFADDRATLPVAGWGAGVTSLRASYQTRLGRSDWRPFLAVNNAWARRYVAAATVNGFGGRVYEPAPGRWVHVGLELGLGAR